MEWIKKNWKIAAAIVVLLIIVLASVADSYRNRKLVQVLQGNLDEAKEQIVEREKTAKKEWEGKVAVAEKRLSLVLAERDRLRGRLDEARAAVEAPFVEPTVNSEIIERFKALGY